MSYCQIALINLVIITAFGRFVAEEVYLVISLNMTQAVCFIPTDRKNIERNLSPLEKIKKR
jgi:uncharacterized membrane protein